MSFPFFQMVAAPLYGPTRRWVGPGMDRNQIRGYGSGHMHWAAVDTDDKGSRA
jgi:hypothetical protein